MRIRKHAKLAGLMLSATASTSTDLSPPPPPPRLQSRICHLNQSPWDVISFPPDSASSPYQVDGEDSFTANGSFGDSIGAVESVASMKILDGDENNNVNNLKNDAPKHAFPIAHENVEEEKIEIEDMEEEREDQVFCCKTDGKGWQCKEKASRGHSLCDHHLAQLRKYNSLAHPSSSKKLEKPPAAAIGRRPRHNKAAVASNPYEFYYYSGFGPRWGKKRGGTRGEPSTATNASASAAANKSDRVEEIVTSQIDHEEFDYVDDDDDEDDEDENEEESGESGKKRTRKPIKARSLKSLM